jgi:hypothetical protein
MKFNNPYIALPLALLLAACGGGSHDEPAQPVGEDNPVYMNFSVTVENPAPATRGTTFPDLNKYETWGDDYTLNDEGTDFDTRVLAENFTPVIFATTDPTKRAGEFEILSYYTAPGTSTTTYFIHGRFVPSEEYPTMEALQKETFRLMIFANTPSAPTDYATMDFEYISNTRPVKEEESEGFDAIPMWGVCEVDMSNLRQGSLSIINENNPCALLRAMAKVTVKINLNATQKGRKVNLTSLALNRYAKNGYVTPHGWNTLANTTDLKFNSTIRECTSSLVNESYETFKVRQQEGTGIDNPDYISFYLPEIANSNENYLELTVNYTVDGAEKSNHIYFCTYGSNGGPADMKALGEWDIVRNHIYEYTITGVQDSKISVEAKVKDWQYHKNTQDLE